MIDLVVLIGWTIFWLLLVPGLVWLIEVMLGIIPAREIKTSEQAVSAVILIPAHNEDQVIKATLNGLAAQLTERDQVLVIADNCSDDTANIVRECGMQVAERFHETERGKGFALAYGVAQIAKREWQPDVVIVLDADCEILAGGLAKLKLAAVASPVQGRYLLTAPEGAGPKQKVSAFAIYVKNHIRLLGLARLGGSVPITGSGFGAPYELFQGANLASGEIVEDMKLGCDWAFANHFTRYAPQVHILSPLPTNDKDADTQRQRWEHGHVSIIKRYMPRLLLAAFKRLRFDYLFTALDMAVPPLTSMVAAYGLLALLLLPLYWQASLIVFGYVFCVLLMLALVNLLAKPRLLNADDIAGLFTFAASKLTLYRKLVRGEKSGWVKTKRDSSVDADKQ